VRETDLAAGGAAAADNPGSRFCQGCGVLFLHPIHLRSEAHRARMGRLQAVRDPPPQPRGDAAAVVVGRMAWDVAFADAIRAALIRAPGAGAAALLHHYRGRFRQDQRRPRRDKRPTSAACWTTSWAAWT
ncbi:unnamed protein product, partial [Ixodes persulcatus]